MRMTLALVAALALLLGGCESAARSADATSTPTVPSVSSSSAPSLSAPSPASPAPLSTPPQSTPPSTATQAPKLPAHNARQRLANLRVVDRQPAGIPRYVRKEFGSSWSDIDGNGCNQRDDVLLRDGHKGTLTTQWQGRCPHDVLAGTWTDPYTGKKLTFTDLKDRKQSQAIQIDHVVPLAEAWRSGAHAWDYEERRQFANTLDNLLAVDGPTNMSKGDLDPAAWRPRKGYQCAYASRWIRVKHDWDLGADASEIRALGEMLDYCT